MVKIFVDSGSSIKLSEKEKYGVEIINDIELASRFFKGKFIAITGTNGKSTTTALLEQILTFSGKKAVACGNIGIPILSLYSIIAQIALNCNGFRRKISAISAVFVFSSQFSDELKVRTLAR